jgi:hypothetical protein
MGIKHTRTATHDDGPDDGRVNPSWWNDDHDIGAFLSALVDLVPTPGTLPYIRADGTGGIVPLSDLVRALLAIADAPTLLASLGAAALDSPPLTGTPTAPTAILNTNTQQIATMAALQQMRADLIASAPATLDTFNEIATALGSDPNFSATILASLGNRLRFDAAQTLTTLQKGQALANLGLALVAASGAYADLTGKPALATVATSGAYADLSGKPVIGTAANDLVQLDGSAKLPAVDGSQLTNVVSAGSVSFVSAQALTALQQAQARKNVLSVGVVNVQAFTASGTYTPSPNLLFAIIEAVGGGGGGAGISSGTSGSSYGAPGGGSGGYSRTHASAATIGASQAVTIGAAGSGAASGAANGGTGGDTSVGSLCVAHGGLGGVFASGGQAGQGGQGAPSGVGSDVAAPGRNGQIAAYILGNISVVGGNGGDSQFGQGGLGPGNTNGVAPSYGYGGGGSGGSQQNTITSKAGGNGAPGFVVITEFCSA